MIDQQRARSLLDDLGLDLTAEQERVVRHAPDGPAVVVAGAGSGKTAVMAARMAVLIAAGGVPASQVLGLTFTRKAAAELADRVDGYLRIARRAGLIGRLESDPNVSTYHSFAQRFVREHGIRCGIDPDLRLESEFGLLPVAFQVVVDSPSLGAEPEHDLSIAKAMSAMRRLDSELAEHVVSTQRLREQESARLVAMSGAKSSERTRAVVAAAKSRILVSHLVDEYRAAKELAGAMDYADLMRLAHHIAATSDEAVRNAREAYSTVLLDEYQDTSVVQRMLLQRLFAAGHQVLAVGDPKQSIYAFRGAAAGSIDAFAEHFPQPSGAPTPEFTLSSNFRSGRAIVAVANDSAASRSARAAGHSNVGLRSGRPELEDIVEAHSFSTDAAETAFLVAEVAAELAAGTPASELLVLARSNETVTALADALESAGIPAVSSDEAGLFECAQVRDLLAEFAVVIDPTANTELLRLLIGPRWRIGVRDLNLLGRRARELAGPAWTASEDSDLLARLHSTAGSSSDPTELPCLADALADPGEGDYSAAARQRFSQLAAELEALGHHAGEPVPDLLARILRVTGAEVEILLDDADGRVAAAIDALLALAASFRPGSPGATSAGFLRLVRLATESGADPGFDVAASVDGVRVMTVHKAKGLQADVVFWPDCAAEAYDTARLRGHWTSTPGALPSDLRGDQPSHTSVIAPLTTREVDEVREQAKRAELAESQRLVYVALTRARRRLVVSNHRWRPQRRRPRHPASHLEALASHPDVAVGTWHEPPGDDRNPFDTSGEPTDYALPTFGAGEVRPLRELADQVAGQLSARESSPHKAESGDTVENALVRRWDADIEALGRELEERLVRQIDVRVPVGLSTSALQRLLQDPESFAETLRRPMPMRSSRQAARGIRFHEWVASRWEQHALLDVTEFTADREIDLASESEVAELIEAFEAGPYADRRPAHIEYPFTVTIGGVVVTGRIDAVFAVGDAEADPGSVCWEVVDWKTGRSEAADEMQLALYRLAWAKVAGVEPDQIRAVFYHVPTGSCVEPPELPTEEEVAQRYSSVVGG
ncbi:MAG: ATP-dependent helicase [Actinobacteria bacterium]|nr:ATP-dependent helicase [Actinomycetota bacterium]MCB9413438.1 ATP-dependent helicase [Actinomycetota bacterium]